MRKLFIKFYLLLIICFLLAVSLAGQVYKQVAEKSGDQSLSDLIRTSLTLIEYHLTATPQAQWPEALDKLNDKLDFSVSIQPMDKLALDDNSKTELKNGDIVFIEEQQTYYQRIRNSHSVLEVGPVGYLLYLHQIRSFDYLLLAMISLSLAIPVLLWLRPHWRDLQQLDRSAKALSRGVLDTRVHLHTASSLYPLANSFNNMADEISLLLNSKQQLLQAVAHELRTPLARLHYRLALLDFDENSPAYQGIEHDFLTINQLIDELLLHAKLSQNALPLQIETGPATPWFTERIQPLCAQYPALDVRMNIQSPELNGDHKLLARAIDNLLINAIRYGNQKILIAFNVADGWQQIAIHDNGPGIPASERTRVLEPFYRGAKDRQRHAEGHGLGLAIVQRIMVALHGKIDINDSDLGGCCIRLSWPLQSVTIQNTA